MKAPFRLDEGEVQVWSAALSLPEGSGGAALGLLGAEERRRALAFKSEAHRRRFTARRALFRILAARYLGLHPGELPLAFAEHGKPYFTGAAAWLKFSLSSSGTRAIFAFSRGLELGVDLECASGITDCEAVAAAFFSAEESRRLALAPPHGREEAFLRIWTHKEAALKLEGCGLPGLERDRKPCPAAFQAELMAGRSAVASLAADAAPSSLMQIHWAPSASSHSFPQFQGAL